MYQVLPALIATFATQVLVSSSVLVGPVLAPLAARDLGIDPANVGFFVSGVYLVAAVTGLVSGGFIARFGAVRISQLALLFAATGLMIESVGWAWTLPLAAMVIGMGVGPPTPASSHILAHVTPPSMMNLVFSLKQTGVPLGGALAGLLMPAIGVAFGWRAAALTAAGLCAIMIVALQPMRATLDSLRNRTYRLNLGRQVLGPLRLVLESPAIRRLTLVAFFYSGTQNCMSALLVTFLVQRVHLDVVEAGFILSVAQIAAAIARVSSGKLADSHLTPSQVLGGMGVVSATCALTVTQFSPAWPFTAVLAVCIVFGISATGWNGVFLAQIARLAPPGRAGELTGGVTFSTFSGVVVMPSLFSAILAVSDSYAIGFAVVAVPTLAGGLSLLRHPAEPARP